MEINSDVAKVPTDGGEFKPPLPPAPVKSVPEAACSETHAVEPEGQLPYTAPSWSCRPLESECRLEVIKNGVVVDRIPLAVTSVGGEGSFVTIGRHKPCHILLEHPSVSRFHCILQYGQFMSQEPRWFLYDLGSTHGTKLNKRQVKKHSYTELRPGYVFQLAESSRIFAFCGPVNEAEMEEEEKAAREARRPVRGPQLNPHGHDDMGTMEGDGEEDGDGEPTTSDDRRAAYYEKDPVGWLQKYFEREGMQLRFQYTRADTVSEGLESMKPKRRKGGGEGADWVCSIDLPDDSSANSPVTLIKASAFTRKLAQFHSALLACERLEAGGVLRSYSMWSKRATYAENDYYDSDEDTYLDRTGQIEEQREKRMRREEALSGTGAKAQNYAELGAKLADSENKLNIVRSELARLLGKNVYTDSEGNVSASTNLSMRIALSQMRSKEKKLVVEVDELQKLVELSRPPDMEKMFPTAGKRPVQPRASRVSPEKKVKMKSIIDDVEGGGMETGVQLIVEANPCASSDGATPEEKDDEGACEKGPNAESTTVGPAPGGAQAKRRSQQPTAEFLVPKYGIITKEESRIKRPVKVKKRTAQETEELADDYADIPLEDQEDYATWLPPDEQTGDGRTKLNEKFKGRY